MATDGYLKIKTKIDNSEVPKGVKELEDKIKKAQVDNTSNSQEQGNLEAEINAYERLQNQADGYHQKLKELNLEKNKITQANPGMAVSQDSAELTNIKAQIDSINQKYRQTVSEIDKQAPKMDKVYARLTKVKAKQAENNAKISEYKQKIESIKTQHIENSLNNAGKSISKQISSIGRMALGIVGISTAWGTVRSAIGLVSQYNTQVSTDLDYMKFCLANAIAPVIQRLISLAMTLLSYINAITSAWFGVNLFTNATAKNFQKMQKGASSTAKSAREIQKSLQGFDEMNILSDNSDAGSSGGGNTGISAPSMDLSSMQAPVPEWLQWIIDNKDLILSVIGGIAGGIAAIKIIDLLKNSKKFGEIFKDITKTSQVFMGLGIGIMIGGIIQLIQDLITFIKDPTWENFANIVRDIGIILAGLAITLIALNMSNPFGWIALAVAGILLLASVIIKHWDEIKEVLGKVGEWIYQNVISPVVEFFKGLWENIKEIFSPFIEFFGSLFSTVLTNIEITINNIKQIISFLWEKIKEILSPVVDFFKDIFEKAYQKVKSVFEPIVNFFSGLWDKVKNKLSAFGAKVGEVIGGAFKSVINGVIGAIESILNTPIKAINKLINKINDIPGINLTKLETFNLPRMAKGGVLTQPTPVIAGEAGKEMIMPLENNLEYLDILADKLASKIGSGGGCYILNIDSKTVQRGMAQRSNGLVFATNGR